MPRRCSLCSHKQQKAINKAISDGRTYAWIASEYGSTDTTVKRHMRVCLGISTSDVRRELDEKQQIQVYEEFCEQLQFAKELRIAAREYLSDPLDPLKLSITPKAHEIEVTYFDHNDIVKLSFGNKVIEKPKKKRAMLSTILESFATKGLEPEKYKFQTTDIRKFALEAIDRADMCIDKFARMGGDYAKEKTNPTDIKALAEEIAASLIREGHPADQVQAEVSKLFPQLVSEAVN